MSTQNSCLACMCFPSRVSSLLHSSRRHCVSGTRSRGKLTHHPAFLKGTRASLREREMGYITSLFTWGENPFTVCMCIGGMVEHERRTFQKPICHCLYLIQLVVLRVTHEKNMAGEREQKDISLFLSYNGHGLDSFFLCCLRFGADFPRSSRVTSCFQPHDSQCYTISNKTRGTKKAIV